eukprot:360484-Chlamydomonas_euryale.AAC.11
MRIRAPRIAQEAYQSPPRSAGCVSGPHTTHKHTRARARTTYHRMLLLTETCAVLKTGTHLVLSASTPPVRQAATAPAHHRTACVHA